MSEVSGRACQIVMRTNDQTVLAKPGAPRNVAEVVLALKIIPAPTSRTSTCKCNAIHPASTYHLDFPSIFVVNLCLSVLVFLLCLLSMAPNFPFRDINVHASPSHYAFSSPSTPTAPTLVIERPTGDIRLTEEKRLGSHRISSIMGILGIITLRLG